VVKRIRGLMQRAVIAFVRPYIRHELPKWGVVYRLFVGWSARDKFWADAPTLRAKNKIFGYESDYDLRKWSDRYTYFLGRWNDLPAQLLTRAVNPAFVIDIGANRGEFSLAAALMNRDARVIAFEPNPAMADIFLRGLERNNVNNVELFQCGLSDKEDTLTLYIPYNNTESASFGGFQSEGFTIGDIPVKIGDQLLRDTKADLIKIDVEGFELHVLRGIRELVRRNQPVVITEMVEEHLARCGTSPEALQSFMRDLGYRGFAYVLERVGSHYELRIRDMAGATDVVWLPSHISCESLHASTHDLRMADLERVEDRSR
jgi:FkbM family methyltransferase